MENVLTPEPMPTANRGSRLPGLLALLAILGALVMLGGCLAEKGLPEEEGGPGSGTEPVTWNDVAALFLDPAECGSCHPPQGSSASTNLDYSPLINNTSGTCASTSQMITVGDRNASCLYLAVSGQEGNTGMATFLSVDEQEMIGAWIDQGAPGP